MFRFESPQFLLLLPLLALIGLAAWYQLGRIARRRTVLAEAELLPGLGMTAESMMRRRKQTLVALGALVLWCVAMANPQYGTRTRLAATRTTEVLIALDISQSMLAEDVRPNRLSRAQLFLEDLMRQLSGERVALVLFAGQAYLQMPLTTDYSAALDLVQGATPDKATTPGTNIAAALGMAQRVLIRPVPEDAPAPAPARRIVLVVSDGENHEPGATQAAEVLAEAGLRVVTVGVGTAAGALVPSDDPRGGGYRRDESGEAVVSQFDPAALRALADEGGGRYYDLGAGAAGVAGEVAAYIDGENLGGGVEERFEERASYYQLLGGLGLLGFGWAWWLGRGNEGRLRLRGRAAL